MKIQYLSDLHLEGGFFQNFVGFNVKEGVDALVLAGDIVSYNRMYLLDIFENVKVPIFYVLGNHEYYHCKGWESCVDNYREFLATECKAKITLLENQAVTLNGVRIIGSTLWSDPSPLAEMSVNRFVYDFRDKVIPAFNIERARSFHHIAKATIKGELIVARHAGMKSLVITHFPPSWMAQDQKYRHSDLGSYFYNDLHDLIELEEPDVWIYGHTHSNIDFNIGKTRVVANQLGYVGKDDEPGGARFNRTTVVEV